MKKIIVIILITLALLANFYFFQSKDKLGLIEEKKRSDFKFWYIKRCDDIHICEAAVRFYEGAITTLPEEGTDGITRDVTRYRRSKRLTRQDVSHLPEKFAKESSGADVKIYTDKDFGVIIDKKDLELFLNKELAKDNLRIPIDEQK